MTRSGSRAAPQSRFEKRMIWEGVSLATLLSLGLAHPLYEILLQEPAFLVAHRFSGWDLGIFVLCLSLAFPLVVALPGFILVRTHPLSAKLWFRVWMAVLTAVLGLLFLKRLWPGDWVFGPAILMGLAVSVVYSRSPLVRGFLRALSPAALVVPLLFLWQAPFSNLQADSSQDLAFPDVPVPTPVVLVILDELPTVSLLNASGQINAERFPNFARLADRSHWFPNATSVSEATVLAVPAIVDGRLPERNPNNLPNFASHPNSLFGLLGGDYSVTSFENATELCPESICAITEDQVRPQRDWSAFWSDIAVVYLHTLLPAQWVGRNLPAVNRSWRDFLGHSSQPNTSVDKSRLGDFQVTWTERHTRFEQFIASIQPESRRHFYFIHSLLPHAPWRFLPSGKHYILYERGGLVGELGPNDSGRDTTLWLEDDWAVLQAQQRHLLQIGFVDSLLGQLLDRLEEMGILEDSLLIVTADHGVSFRSEDSRRGVTESNFNEILGVPLFVKLPNQAQGVVDRKGVQTIDILPTVIDVLDVPVDWPMEGRSLLETGAEPVLKALLNRGPELYLEFSTEMFQAAQRRSLDENLGRWGERPLNAPSLLAPCRELLGRRVSSQDWPTLSQVSLDRPYLLDRFNSASKFVPAFIQGKLLPNFRERPECFAIAVNGVIQGTTRTYQLAGYQDVFESLIPESAYRPGRNLLQVFAVEGRNDALQLKSIYRPQVKEYELRKEDGKILIVAAQNGLGYPVRGSSDFKGWVVSWHAVELGIVGVGGWAADLNKKTVAEQIVLFLDGKFLFSLRPDIPHGDVLDELGDGSSDPKPGFRFEYPAEMIGDSETRRLQVFALAPEGFAVELYYPGPEYADRWVFGGEFSSR